MNNKEISDIIGRIINEKFKGINLNYGVIEENNNIYFSFNQHYYLCIDDVWYEAMHYFKIIKGRGSSKSYIHTDVKIYNNIDSLQLNDNAYDSIKIYNYIEQYKKRIRNKKIDLIYK